MQELKFWWSSREQTTTKNVNCQTLEKLCNYRLQAYSYILVTGTTIKLTETAFDYILKAVGKHRIVIEVFILTQRRTQVKCDKQTTQG